MDTWNSGSLTNNTKPYQNPGMGPKPLNGPNYGPQFGQPSSGNGGTGSGPNTLSPLVWGMPPQISGGVGGTMGTPYGPNAGSDHLNPYPPPGGNSGSATGSGTGPNPGMPPKPIGDPNYGKPTGSGGNTGNALGGWQTTGTQATPVQGLMANAAGVASKFPMINQQSAQGMAPGNPYAQFSNSNNLISSQITTNPSERTLGAQGMTDQAKNNYANYQFQPFNAMNPLDTSRTENLLQQGNSQVQGMQGFQYNPVAGTDLSGAQKYLAQAGANVGPSAAASGLMGAGQTGGFGYSGDTQGLRSTTQQQLDKTLNNTPDRAQLASDAYNLLLERSQPQEFAQDRGYAQKQAALGRAGSGMFNSGLADIATQRETTRDQARRDLANNAAGLSLQDQMDKLNAARGVTSDFSGYDTAAGSLNLGYQNANNAERGAAFDRARAIGNDTFNQNMGLSSQSANLAGITRNDALTERDALRTSGLDNNNVLSQKAASNRTLGSDLYGLQSDAYSRGVNERDAGLNYDQNLFNNRQNIFGNLATDEQRLLGNDRYAADEMRGERGYQYGLSRDAIGDQRQQVMDQEALLNGRFGRGQALTNAGYAGDPTGVYGQQAQNYGQQASDSYASAGNLFGQWALGNPATAPRPNVYAQGQ